MYVIGKNKTVTETGNPRNEIIFPALMSETSWKVMYNARRRPRYLYCFIKMIKNFLLSKLKNMVRADVFIQVLWQFLSVRRSRNFAHPFRAACGGENGSDYLYYPAPRRKLQVRGDRLASLGGQFVLDFGRKNQLAILNFARRKFLIQII